MFIIHINTEVTNPLIFKYDMIESIDGDISREIFFSFDKTKWFEKNYFQTESITEINYSGLSFLGFNIFYIITRKLKIAMG